jgi:hypothetical protein
VGRSCFDNGGIGEASADKRVAAAISSPWARPPAARTWSVGAFANRTPNAFPPSRAVVSGLVAPRVLSGTLGVIGVGFGLRERAGLITDEPAWRAYVRRKQPFRALFRAERLPKAIDGIAVDVLERPTTWSCSGSLIASVAGVGCQNAVRSLRPDACNASHRRRRDMQRNDHCSMTTRSPPSA